MNLENNLMTERLKRSLKYIESSSENINSAINELLITLKDNRNTLSEKLTLSRIFRREKEILKFEFNYLITDIVNIIESMTKEDEVIIINPRNTRESENFKIKKEKDSTK